MAQSPEKFVRKHFRESALPTGSSDCQLPLADNGLQSSRALSYNSKRFGGHNPFLVLRSIENKSNGLATAKL